MIDIIRGMLFKQPFLLTTCGTT